MEQSVNLIANPVIQYGFAGVTVVLLVIMVWLIRCLLEVIRAQQKIQQETNAILAHYHEELGKRGSEHAVFAELMRDSLKLQRSNREDLLARPCIASRRQVFAAAGAEGVEI